MKKLKSNDNTLDRLSALPDSLILEILSLLEMKDVVRTSLLSKRWKYLWITIPCLRFDDMDGDVVELRNFVNRTLMLWRGTHLRKLKVSDCGESELNDDVNLWTLFAMERKVEELSLHVFSPLECLYEYSSLRKLKLEGFNLEIDGNVQWDRLKSLKVNYGNFSEDVIDQVLSSSPQLETFKSDYNVHQGDPNLNIRSSSLKKLWLGTPDDEELSVLTIWAPNLQSMKLFGEPYKKYFLTNVSSLTNVYIGLKCHSYATAVVKKALSQIFPAIQHVVTVTLSADCFKVLGVVKDKYSVSPLSKVKVLKIDCGMTQLSQLLGLLDIFPKVKMLIFDWKLHPKDYGKSFKFILENYIASQALNILKSNLFQLRTFEITCYSYQASMFQVIEFMLKHATMLEKMVIRKSRLVDSEHREVVDFEDMFLTAQKVVSLQRSFPSVEVELILC